MKAIPTFILTTAISTGLFLADNVVTAKADKPLAVSPAVAVMQNIEIGGKLIQKADGVYAQFTLTNPSETDTEASFHYAARCLPATAMMSRMIRMPDDVKNEAVKIHVKASESVIKEILIRKDILSLSGKKPTEIKSRDLLKSSLKDQWTLVVSPQPIPKTAALRAVLPVPASGRKVLKKGAIVVAASRQVSTKR